MSEIKITQDGGKTFPMINSTKGVVGDGGHNENMFIGDAEVNPHELFMDADGEWRVVSKEERNEGLVNLPKGTKVLSNDETAQCIQSWYENRRD